MKLKLHSVGAAMLVAVMLGAPFASQIGYGDTITNAVTAITGTVSNDVIKNISPTNVSAILLFSTNAPGKALSVATGIDGLGGDDQITSTAEVRANAQSTLDIASGNFDYRGKEAAAVGTGIAGGDGQDAITNTATLTSTTAAWTDIGEVFCTIVFGVTGLPTEANAASVGIDGGGALDRLFNSGPITVSANATSEVSKVRISSLEIPVDVFGFGDARTVASSVALGISAGINELLGSLQQTIQNYGALSVQAGADASAWQLAVELIGAARVDDTTTAKSRAVGIAGDVSDDHISHFGTMDIDAVSKAELDSAELKMKGLMVKGMFDLFGADVGKISTTAEAQALGMDGGAGNDVLLNAQTNGIFDVHSRAEADSTSITLSISVPISGGGTQPPAPAATASLLTTASPAALAVGDTNTPPGTAYGDAGTKAWATATGLSGGAGNDTLDNRGPQRTFAEAYADSVGVAADISISPTNKLPIPGMAIAGATTSAQAEAIGLDGGNGFDTLLNSGRLEAMAKAEGDSTSVGVVFKGSTKGFNIGVTMVDSSSEAVATSTGIAGGAGWDAITNNAVVVASTITKDTSTSVSVEIAGDKVGVAAGVALARATTVSSGTAVGINGGTGNDVIHNTASVDAIGYSESDSVGVGVTFNATLEGVAGGGALTDTSSRATSLAVGIYDVGSETDIGGETVINSGAIAASATARGDSDAISVNVAGAKVGLAGGTALADATTSARADAYGIDLGQEIFTTRFLGDHVLNSGSVKAAAAAMNSALAVSVAISAALQGAAGGVSLIKSDATAGAAATAIRTGHGDDFVFSEGGAMTATATAQGSSSSIAVAASGGYQGFASGAAVAKATTTAAATAKGIDSGDGQDTIINGTAITNSATADASSLSVAAVFSGAWQGSASGVSLADVRTTAAALATGIDSGAGSDTITNSTTIASRAAADAESKSIGVTVAIAVEGTSSGFTVARAGTESAAASTGISSGAGWDTVTTRSLLDVDANAKTKSKTIAVNVAEGGAALVDASSTATASAIGVDGGGGIDTLMNEGTVDVAATSTMDAANTAANLAGHASANAGMTNTAGAIGIYGGNSDALQTVGETIHNASGGSVNVLALATTDVKNYVVQGGGFGFVDAGVRGEATAMGLAGGTGGDLILNEGTVNVVAWSGIDATSLNYQLTGVQLSKAGVNASAAATGVEGGAGQNIVTNTATGFITAYANVDTLAGNLAANFGGSFTLSGATADAVARGIYTGADPDLIVNSGRIDVTATSLGQAGAASIGLFGLNFANSLATATIEGINAGAGNDWIVNEGTITAGRLPLGATNLVKADSEIATLEFLAIGLAGLGARADVTGIAGADGQDAILNAGTISVGDTNGWQAWGEAYAVGGQWIGLANIHAGSAATVTASAIDGGQGGDAMANTSTGTIAVDARSGAYADSLTYYVMGFAMPSTAHSTANATVTATGIQGGAGADSASNAGSVDVKAYAFALADSDSEISFDIASEANADSNAKGTATAKGIDLGSGANWAENTGSVKASAVAQAKAYATTDSLFEATKSEAYAQPVATAAGIAGGNDGNTVRNAANGTIVVSAAANTTDALGNVSYANSDTGRDAIAVAGAVKSGGGYRPIEANATGISTGTNADTVFNNGSITVSALSDGLVSANTHVWYRYPQSDALAYVAATGKGIAVGTGQNRAVNNGQLTITGWGNAVTRASSWSRDYSATANSAANVNAVATGIEADGMVTNAAAGDIGVVARATSYVEAYTESEEAYATANLNATAAGMATASGTAAPGPDHVVNDGTIRVWALAGENDPTAPAFIALTHTDIDVRSCQATSQGTSVVHAVGIRLGDRGAEAVNNGSLAVAGRALAWVSANAHSRDYHPAAVSIASSDSLAHGILAGNGNNVLVNNGDLSVTAYAEGRAWAYADENVGVFRDEEARATAYANARAYGIQTGNGNNTIVNNGSIVVTALSTAAASAETEDNDVEYRTSAATASVVGIQTGSGNDIILNRGTITSTSFNHSQLAAGPAIDSGAGDDTVSLLDNSYTRGDILLGPGNDTLELGSAPVIDGRVEPGPGRDTLKFVGAGIITDVAGLLDFEEFIKTGAGVFALPQLAPLQDLDLHEGTLQINGSYQFGSNSTFRALVNKDGTYGQLQVLGKANLAGSLTALRGAGPYPIGRITYDVIVATNGLTGMFTETQLPPPRPLLTFGLNQLSDRVQVEAVGLSFTTAAQNGVERAVADYVDRILPTSTGDLMGIVDMMQQMSEPELSPAFSSLSPDSYDNYTRATHSLVQQYSKSVQQRLDTIRLSAVTAASGPQTAGLVGQNPVLLALAGSAGDIGGRLAQQQQREAERANSVWASGFGQWSEQEGKDGYTGFHFSPWGVALGYDRAVSQELTLGVSGAYASTHMSLDESHGSGESESYWGAAYGSYFKNNFHFEGVLSYGYNDYKNRRNLVLGSISRTAESTHDGHAFGGFVSGGYTWQFKHWALAPFASLQYTYLDESGFQESGANSVSLSLRDRRTDSLVSELGLRLAYVLRKKSFRMIPELSLAWNYNFDIDDRMMTASFAGSPNAAFSIPGRKVDPHGMTAGAGVTFLFGKGISTSVSYKGELRDSYSSHAVLGMLNFTF